MSVIKTGTTAHDLTLLQAETTRQVALAAATTQSAAKTADLAYANTARASSIGMNNSANIALFNSMLRELGQYA